MFIISPLIIALIFLISILLPLTSKSKLRSLKLFLSINVPKLKCSDLIFPLYSMSLFFLFILI